MKYGKINIAAGLLFMAGFMIYGFILIYLRDFGPNKEQWTAEYSTGKHFQARLALSRSMHCREVTAEQLER